jgi:hypothetical protein
MPNGHVVKTAQPVKKTRTGHDLTRLLIGAEAGKMPYLEAELGADTVEVMHVLKHSLDGEHHESVKDIPVPGRNGGSEEGLLQVRRRRLGQGNRYLTQGCADQPHRGEDGLSQSAS